MIHVNGKEFTVRGDVTLEQLVGEMTAVASGIAAAVNGEVVPRGQWIARTVRDGDLVEIVTAVQGG